MLVGSLVSAVLFLLLRGTLCKLTMYLPMIKTEIRLQLVDRCFGPRSPKVLPYRAEVLHLCGQSH